MNNDDKEKIKNFYDIYTWQQAHELVVEIYKITKTFPKDETYGLISQLRRAAVSVTSNIAEGFSRKSVKEKAQFYDYARASISEIQSQLFVSRDVGYISTEECNHLFLKSVSVHKLLNRFMAGLKNL
ncbi:four helix bundle protein [Candidatus Uhrbacteria bacterium]|nr:four helix bundle protein [Candidatus Uhrbacteria bacterium]